MDLSGAGWRKSSRSGNNVNGACVEVACVGPVIAVRDSKSPAAGSLLLSARDWRTFLTTWS